MKPLEPPDTHHLNAAEGWLELGNPKEAGEELDRITPAFHTHFDVLELRWQINAKAGKWENCFNIANAVVAANSGQPNGWIHRSFALHEMKRTEEAMELLEPAVKLFSDVWTIRYNLACYACQLGNRDQALVWLAEASVLAGDHKQFKLMALQDKDLEPLWPEIGKI